MQSNIKPLPRILAVIPVRMESSRLPNKPLASIAGKPLVLWVWEHASKSESFTKVVIATDSLEIQAVAKAAGAEVVMTSAAPVNGTERVAEALSVLGGEWDIVFNVQGDMPFIQPAVIDQVAQSFKENIESFDMATLALPIKEDQEYRSESCVKVVFGPNHKALYFSRASIPHYRSGNIAGTGQAPLSYKHIGLYAFKPQALRKIVALEATALEKAESLEQLRALEHGFEILVVSVSREIAGPSIEVDTPADLEKSNQIATTYLMP